MEEWVRVILLLSNQSEVPKAYYTEKQTKRETTSNIQNVQPDRILGPKAPADQIHDQSRMTSGPDRSLPVGRHQTNRPDPVDARTRRRGRWICGRSLRTCSQGGSDKEDEGLTQVCKHIHLYKDAWAGHGDKWRASCCCPLGPLSIAATVPPRPTPLFT